MVFTDQIFLGHIGTHEMAAAALGNMVGLYFLAAVPDLMSTIKVPSAEPQDDQHAPQFL